MMKWWAKGADPAIFNSFQSGISQQDLANFESGAGITLPATMVGLCALLLRSVTKT